MSHDNFILKWTIEDQAKLTQFILRVRNFSVLAHYTWNVRILGDMNSYFFHKNKRDLLSFSIVAFNRCNKIFAMSNNVVVPSTFSRK